ncbi:hypothetical protein [Bradyrhizobium sp. 143]|uniref:hypothetical protein n=1 Tax=Bradyrhizobium sp. 143 TaxID=2782619 RepID=UPI001FFB91BB|nr:hypothetical protein [Bradyrhizobium sp. 143]MCK1715035.1 hypothetical protein [Bradyrhizobium sp. 143]
MKRKSEKPGGAPAEAADGALPAPLGGLELRKRPSGRWGVFNNGIFVATTGTSDARLAAICLRRYQRSIH